MGGTQSRSGRSGEEKNSQPLPGLEPPTMKPVAKLYATELSRTKFYRLEKFLKIKRSKRLSNVTGEK
jgi:hypothetical protein